MWRCSHEVGAVHLRLAGRLLAQAFAGVERTAIPRKEQEAIGILAVVPTRRTGRSRALRHRLAWEGADIPGPAADRRHFA